MNYIKSNTILIIVFVVLLTSGLTFYFIQSQNGQSQIEDPGTKIDTNASAATSSSTQSNVKTFDISGKPFEFDLKEIIVKKGDTVKINFINTLGFHDLTVDGYNVKTKQIQAGQTDSIEFIADKPGIFEYYCSVPTHKLQGMVGKLIVEE